MNFNLQELLENLKKTQAYCALQLNNAEKNYVSILRSINPLFDDSPIFNFSISKVATVGGSYFYTPFVNWTRDPYDRDKDGLFEELYQIQKQVKEQTHSLPDTALKGEILAFGISATLWDGAAAVSSYGILDDYNCPPIDSWFYLYEDLLLAWIPEPFVSYVQEGIEVNPEECINWFKVWYPDVYAQIYQAMPDVFVEDIQGLPKFLQK
jgi:hypothetical protein